jgi:hypothetical protein
MSFKVLVVLLGRMNPHVVCELMVIAFHVLGNQLPDHVRGGEYTIDDVVRDGLEPGVKLFANHLVVVLTDQNATDIFRVERHPSAGRGCGEASREVRMRNGSAIDILLIAAGENPLCNVNVPGRALMWNCTDPSASRRGLNSLFVLSMLLM